MRVSRYLTLGGFIMMMAAMGYFIVVYLIMPLVEWLMTRAWDVETVVTLMGIIGLILFLIGVYLVPDNETRMRNR